MKTLRIGLLSVALTLLTGAPALAQTGHDLFQQALVMEQAEGDLQEAIQLYERIVEEFGGSLAVESEVGNGTRAWVDLPAIGTDAVVGDRVVRVFEPEIAGNPEAGSPSAAVGSSGDRSKMGPPTVEQRGFTGQKG